MLARRAVSTATEGFAGAGLAEKLSPPWQCWGGSQRLQEVGGGLGGAPLAGTGQGDNVAIESPGGCAERAMPDSCRPARGGGLCTSVGLSGAACGDFCDPQSWGHPLPTPGGAVPRSAPAGAGVWLFAP